MLPTTPSIDSIKLEDEETDEFPGKAESQALRQVPRLSINESISEWLSDVTPPPYSNEGTEVDSDNSEDSRAVSRQNSLLEADNTAWLAPSPQTQTRPTFRARRSTVSHPVAQLIEGARAKAHARLGPVLSPHLERFSSYLPNTPLTPVRRNTPPSSATPTQETSSKSHSRSPKTDIAVLLESENSAWGSTPASPISTALASITAVASLAVDAQRLRSRRRATISCMPGEMPPLRRY